MHITHKPLVRSLQSTVLFPIRKIIDSITACSVMFVPCYKNHKERVHTIHDKRYLGAASTYH
jgi:hypothetical protein